MTAAERLTPEAPPAAAAAAAQGPSFILPRPSTSCCGGNIGTGLLARCRLLSSLATLALLVLQRQAGDVRALFCTGPPKSVIKPPQFPWLPQTARPSLKTDCAKRRDEFPGASPDVGLEIRPALSPCGRGRHLGPALWGTPHQRRERIASPALGRIAP